MRTVHVRRHAERVDRADERSELSEAGRAMCVRLARDAPRYALVVSSPLARAVQTARLVGGRIDRIEPTLLPELHGLPFGFWEEVHDLQAYRELHRRRQEARRLGAEQAAVWASLAASLADGAVALAVSHGAVIELGAVTLAQALSVELQGSVFGYCEGVAVTFERDVPRELRELRVA